MTSLNQAARIASATGLLLTLMPVAWGQSPSDAALVIQETDSSFELTVPVSRLTMVIPKAGLSRNNGNSPAPTNSPRYFFFNDSSKGLVISGWFEPAESFKGVKQFWADETGAWKRGGLPPVHNVQFGSIGEWQAISYDMEILRGNNSHIRAHFVRAGTWIDVHLSATASSSRDELHSLLEAFLNSISVSEKP